MPKTLSTSPIDPTRDGSPDDLDNLIVDDLESLRQRVVQRLRFPIGTWQLDTRRGTESTLGHGITPALAASIISDAIRDEGGAEITSIANVVALLDRGTRTFTYSAAHQHHLRHDAAIRYGGLMQPRLLAPPRPQNWVLEYKADSAFPWLIHTWSTHGHWVLWGYAADPKRALDMMTMQGVFADPQSYSDRLLGPQV